MDTISEFFRGLTSKPPPPPGPDRTQSKQPEPQRVFCPACKKFVTEASLSDHTINSCPLRQITCVCKSTFFARDLEQHNTKTCPERIVVCPCKASIKATERAEHWKTCPCKQHGAPPPPPPGGKLNTNVPSRAPAIEPERSVSGCLEFGGVLIDVFVLWHLAKFLSPWGILRLGATCKTLALICDDENLWSTFLEQLRFEGWNDPMKVRYQLEGRHWKVIPTGLCKNRYLNDVKKLKTYIENLETQSTSYYPSHQCYFCHNWHKLLPGKDWRETWERGNFFPILEPGNTSVVVCCCFGERIACQARYNYPAICTPVIMDHNELRAALQYSTSIYACPVCRTNQYRLPAPPMDISMTRMATILD